jgi:hypothetical protein
MAKFDYQVLQLQLSRVTFINGEWQGALPVGEEDALESCLWVWDHLKAVGKDGWELTTALHQPGDDGGIDHLYLKREV